MHPRNACGDCFARVVSAASPRFRVQELRPNLWSVRLTVVACGSEQDLGGGTLNDVWVLTHGGRVVHSTKTRGYSPACGGVTSTCATGPALFVEAADEPSYADVQAALARTF